MSFPFTRDRGRYLIDVQRGQARDIGRLVLLLEQLQPLPIDRLPVVVAQALDHRTQLPVFILCAKHTNTHCLENDKQATLSHAWRDPAC
jgi:hypothetical protein